MSYTKTNWVNDETPVNATNMNKIESKLEDLDTNIENLSNNKLGYTNTTNLITSGTISSGSITTTYTASQNCIYYFFSRCQATNNGSLTIKINNVAIVDNTSLGVTGYMYNLIPIFLQKDDILSIYTNTNLVSSYTVFGIK